MTHLNTYVLGILWALGRYVDETNSSHQYFFIRHSREFFLEVLRQEMSLRSKVHTVLHKGKTQYRLKVSGLDINALEHIGWQSRNAGERNYPRIKSGHRDFIRAYLEIHSTVDTILIRKRNRKSYKQPRLRIFGNLHFLDELTQVLANQIEAGIKKPQISTRQSEVSGTLYYQSIREVQNIFEYLYRPPVEYYDWQYYDRFSGMLREWSE